MQLGELKGLRVAILGTGKEGRSAYTWLLKNQPDLAMTLIDESTPGPDMTSVIKKGTELIVEPLNAKRLCSFDVLIRSPGISPYREALQAAKEQGVQITTPTNLWFAAHPHAQTICISGTKGKSTTSALLAHMLEHCGYRVGLAGNIGQALLDCDINAADWWVIELSSYQIADLEAVPSMAALLNLSPEHLDWHVGETNYKKDKLRLASLTDKGVVIANAEDSELAEHFASAANVTWFNSKETLHHDGKDLFNGRCQLDLTMPTGLPGRHNLSNVAAALTLVNEVGADLDEATRAVSSFQSLPHRLQVLGKSAGVTFINDSISSTPVATSAALETLSDQPLILIIGGLDRGIDWSTYGGDFVRWLPRAVIGIPGNGPDIIRCLEAAGVSPHAGFHLVTNLQKAVELAKSLAREGDVVALSPGAPSFPEFTDFQERGQAFTRFCGLDDIFS